MSSSTAAGEDIADIALPSIEAPQWRKHLPYLYSITLPQLLVSDGKSTIIKETRILLITRSDGIQKIGYLPQEDKDTRLGDGTDERRAYLCKLGSILAEKAGISSGGNKPYSVVWDALPEVLFGYEIFERERGVSASRRGDLYVVGHPSQGNSESLFRTPGEFAEHLLWLAEGDEDKECMCLLCKKEKKQKSKEVFLWVHGDWNTVWKILSHQRTKPYMNSTTLGSFWGELPDLVKEEEEGQ